jgi:hypothetical protein
VRDAAAAPVFVSQGFAYGQDLRYGARYSNWTSNRYGMSFRYRLGTQLRRPYERTTGMQYRMNRQYVGTGRLMRNGYRLNINYGSQIQRPFRRYGFTR